jgi:hypothetical protein
VRTATEKGLAISHQKVPGFLDTDALENGMDNPISNFAQRVM